MLSTFHEVKLAIKDRVNKNYEPVLIPNTVIDYCKHIGEIDMNDQIYKYYHGLRKRCELVADCFSIFLIYFLWIPIFCIGSMDVQLDVEYIRRFGFKRKQPSFCCQNCDVAHCVHECFKHYHFTKHFHGENYSQFSDSDDSDKIKDLSIILTVITWIKFVAHLQFVLCDHNAWYNMVD